MQSSHHVNELDTSQSNAGSGFRLEAEHGSYPAFDVAMILFDGIVHIFAGPDSDGLSTLPQPVLSIALHDGHPIEALSHHSLHIA
ncbi:hypothetical protein IL59_0215215 [Brucella suis bv. 4 str. 40]|nr:hypothetical protein IL59_0215215 [Brucella suis bv. 4 str. 40]